MGVTTIRDVRHPCSAPATVRNTQQNIEGVVAPGTWRELAMPIPWCLPWDDFKLRHIDVLVGGRLFTIWQADRGGADLVRVSRGNYVDPGPPIRGAGALAL